jgi:hypothetical protein
VRSIDQQHEGTNQNDSISSDAVNEHLEALTSRPNQLRLVHINTQSMVSSFDELILLIKEYPYDVITMSETWLKNNPHLLNYVTIPGIQTSSETAMISVGEGSECTSEMQLTLRDELILKI